MSELTPGARFQRALKQEQPLQIAGAINAYAAKLAEHAGFRALYLSGAGVANASYGLPDLGITSLDNVLEEVRRMTNTTELPLLVDAETGWGGALNIARTVQQMIRAGAAAIHIEDQEQAKRCGHRPGKTIVSTGEMTDRIKAAVDARTDPHFVIMARTDAVAKEGISLSIERACAYVEAGADMIFPEALSTLEEYRQFVKAVKAPIVANITEFGVTPLFTREELHAAGVEMILYPLSAFRAMSQAAVEVYQTIRKSGSQQPVIKKMQTRQALYDLLNYEAYEKKLDQFKK